VPLKEVTAMGVPGIIHCSDLLRVYFGTRGMIGVVKREKASISKDTSLYCRQPGEIAQPSERPAVVVHVTD
jgi:hypothetical protein